MTATERSVTLVIPRHPPPSLNALLTMPWHKRHAHARLWQTEAAHAWLNAGKPHFERCRITITLYARGDRQIRDAENLSGSCKALIDGLKELAFPDDSIDIIGTPTFVREVDNKRPRVEIRLEAA